LEYYENPEVDWFTPSDFGDELFLTNSRRKINSKAISDGVAKLFNPFSVLIIGIGATLGKIGIIDSPASSNQQINSIEFNEFMNPIYGAYFLKTFETAVKNMSNAATLAILNQSNTKNLVIICPPKKEQDNISKHIVEKVTHVDSTTSRITKEIDLLLEYKISLINETVIGKIDVRDYNITNA
jgi:restriction endonuclease S subunit